MEKKKSESGSGKAKQSRSWMLTISLAKHDRDQVEEALEPYTYIGQVERGEGGFKHIQLVIENKTPIRFETLKRKLPKAHIESRKGTLAQAVAYCTKPETRVSGEPRLENGVIPSLNDERGRRTDLERIREAILDDGRSVDDVLLTMPEAARVSRYVGELASARDRERADGVMRDVKTTYIYGDPGVGKTRRVYESHGDHLYRVVTYKHPFDGYAGQQTLVLDEFAGQIDLPLMNSVLDHYPLLLPCRYHDKPAMYNEVFILSNLPPWALYSWEPEILRRAFVRRLDRVVMIDGDGVAHDVDLDSVRSRFGMVTAATPLAALEAVPDCAVDQVSDEPPAVLPLAVREAQPPF